MSSFTVSKEISPRTGKISWIARWDFTDDDGTRRHRKKAFRTRDEARAHRDTIAAELRTGTYHEPADITTGEWLRQWSETLHGRRAPSTIHVYRQAVKHRYGPIERIPLAKLRRSHIDALLVTWQTEGLASQTRASALRILRTALRRAVDDGLIKTDPSAKVEAPRIERKRPVVWSASQMQAFLAATEHHRDGLLFRTILLTLMREGEVAALDWADVDLERGVLHVHRTLQRQADGSWDISDRAKSAHGTRTIPLGPDLIARLTAHRDDQQARRDEHGPFWIDDGAVFDRGNGKRHSSASIAGRWQALIAPLDLPRMSVHGLRHGGATLLIEQGVNIKAVSELLGHSDPAFTYRIYVNPLEAERRSAAELLETATRAPSPLRLVKRTG